MSQGQGSEKGRAERRAIADLWRGYGAPKTVTAAARMVEIWAEEHAEGYRGHGMSLVGKGYQQALREVADELRAIAGLMR